MKAFYQKTSRITSDPLEQPISARCQPSPRRTSPSVAALPWFRAVESDTKKRAVGPRRRPVARHPRREAAHDEEGKYRSAKYRACSSPADSEACRADRHTMARAPDLFGLSLRRTDRPAEHSDPAGEILRAIRRAHTFPANRSAG